MFTIIEAECLEWMRSQPDDCVDLVIGSPPYAEKGKRYIGGKGKRIPIAEWVPWMVEISEEALRITRGYVLWVVNGAVRRHRYLPAVEGLIWECHCRGLWIERPCIWHKNSTPSRKNWFVNDWEFIVALRKSATAPFDWQSIADPPKHKSGGRFRQRDANGKRRLGSEYPKSKLARPRDVLRVTVGGGHMGSDLATENEAPYPEKLVEPFVKVLCPVGGVVLDPFAGSGTTCAVAERLGRDSIGIDVRDSQVKLSKRRLSRERNE